MAVIDMEKIVTSTAMPVNSTEIPWVETTIVGGFRIWQVLFLAGAVLSAVGTRQFITAEVGYIFNHCGTCFL